MAQKLDEKKEAEVSDYLQANKKRKKYALLAFGDRFNNDLRDTVQKFLKESYGKLSVSSPKNLKDFQRFMNRQVSLVIIDDSFSTIAENVQLVQELKQKRKDEAVPVLFLTEHSTELVQAYNKSLALYQEVDMYLSYSGITGEKLVEGIRFTLEGEAPRRTRRYTIDWPVKLLDTAGTEMNARLIDMSIHGAQLASESDHIFREGEQFKVRIPIGRLLPITFGEFMKIPAKVRRVSTAGNKAGVSWEYLNDGQLTALTELLTSYISRRT